jgi:hypothetical protein
MDSGFRRNDEEEGLRRNDETKAITELKKSKIQSPLWLRRRDDSLTLNPRRRNAFEGSAPE